MAMDPVLKRRLVGAAVLWVAAMLVLPWILDPARHSTPDPTVVASSDPDREMRTIDLTPPPLPEAPAVSTTVPAASEPEPSVEPPPALAEMEEAPVKAQPEERAPQKPSAPAPVAAPKPSPAKPAPAPVVTAPKPAATKPQPPAPAPAPPAPASVATVQPPTPSPGASGAAWSVQVGSFGDIQNAQSLAARLLQRQHSAQVSTLVVNGRTLYRVRVGHLGRREDAEALRVRIEQSMGLNGRVVPDP
jgi:DedD protein